MSLHRWGGGPETALLLHCTLAQGGAWAGVARHLRDRFTMIAPDLLSHGKGPRHDPARDFHDQATEEAAKHLPDRPTHLIGHSFGATLALRLALEHPAQVKSLTMIEPVLFCAANGPGRRAHDAQIAGVPAALAKGDTPAAARIFLDLWGSESFDAMPAALQAYITDRIWIPEACDAALSLDTARILPRLSQIAVPTLLLRGAMSPPVMSEVTSRLARDVPGARVDILPDAGHMAPITHPRATAAAITRAL
ncbi:alpha/beta fold hydrolase [Gymnodinialimonas ceratoperidinii]|uniref:Alpha/beta hydrolase n=1 Tax=Gymnodinialimonas ceratoperidinii TaxID=2856823 RepID=A0A8F6TW35_9RHOB|nr:alpha/beta hydrolase [Gymnodinialimonas ceratoperidinii]QXT39259.1 alpha/beta hydrolase [Gymnodinialimonas ceratoperidinii]